MVGSSRAGFCSLSTGAWGTAFSCSLPALTTAGISLSHTLCLISLSGTVIIAGGCRTPSRAWLSVQLLIVAGICCNTSDSLINHSIAD